MDHPALLTAYTRTEAIKHGFLVDVASRAKLAGFTIPVALTPAVWSACVAWTPAHLVGKVDPAQLKRLDALLARCMQAVQRGTECPAFQVESVTADAAVLFASDEAGSLSLKAVMDLSDAPAGPAMTIMLQDEY